MKCIVAYLSLSNKCNVMYLVNLNITEQNNNNNNKYFISPSVGCILQILKKELGDRC